MGLLAMMFVLKSDEKVTSDDKKAQRAYEKESYALPNKREIPLERLIIRRILNHIEVGPFSEAIHVPIVGIVLPFKDEITPSVVHVDYGIIEFIDSLHIENIVDPISIGRESTWNEIARWLDVNKEGIGECITIESVEDLYIVEAGIRIFKNLIGLSGYGFAIVVPLVAESEAGNEYDEEDTNMFHEIVILIVLLF